jgi:hypothetical protein
MGKLEELQSAATTDRQARIDLAAAFRLARATGLPFRKVRPEVVGETYRMILADTPRYAGAHFAALKRILDRAEPDYAR